MAPSLDARQDILMEDVLKLGKEAPFKAIKEWGHPKSNITHLVFCSTNGVDMFGVNSQLIRLFGLNPSLKQVMLYYQGCFVNGTMLFIVQDLIENNKGFCVLIMCSKITIVTFRGIDDIYFDNLIVHALFVDDVAALIVGANMIQGVERLLFQMTSAAQLILLDSEGAIEGHLREVGLIFHLLNQVPTIISKNTAKSLVEAFQLLGISKWNSLFWIAHLGGPTILDNIESKLKLKSKKLRTTWQMLSEDLACSS